MKSPFKPQTSYTGIYIHTDNDPGDLNSRFPFKLDNYITLVSAREVKNKAFIQKRSVWKCNNYTLGMWDNTVMGKKDFKRVEGETTV